MAITSAITNMAITFAKSPLVMVTITSVTITSKSWINNTKNHQTSSYLAKNKIQNDI